jgi:hypothetical protein
MKREDRPSGPDIDALLERGRIIPRAPDAVRARALARARASLANAATIPPTATAKAQAPGRGWRVAVAAAVVLGLVAAGATAALYRRASRLPDHARAAGPGPVAPVRVAAPAPAPSPATIASPVARAKAHRPVQSGGDRESYAAELDLLQRAQIAYAGHDFPEAMVPISEHARRFPNGRLAEQREALRIRTLAGSGRIDEARRASVAFANRFPRSVLIPRLSEMSEARRTGPAEGPAPSAR